MVIAIHEFYILMVVKQASWDVKVHEGDHCDELETKEQGPCVAHADAEKDEAKQVEEEHNQESSYRVMEQVNGVTMLVPGLHGVKVDSDVLLLHRPPVGLIYCVCVIFHDKVELFDAFTEELNIRAPVEGEVNVGNVFV